MRQKILSLLVLLLTAATGAWAEETPLVTIESKDYVSFTSGSKTFDNIATVTFSSEVANSGGWGWYHTNGTTLTVTPVKGITITRVKFTNEEGSAYDETAPFEAVLGDGEPWNNPYMIVNGNSIGYYGVTKIEVYGTAAPDVEVTTNAASEGATFTEASFQMPAFDATAEYELVRDMSVQMTTKVGDGEDGAEYRIRVKKNEQGEGYVPAEMDVQQVIALFKVHDAIENKDLAFSGDGAVCAISIYAADDNDLPTGTAISFANLEPGRYVAVATAADGSAYDGQTAASNVLVLFEGYPVEVPAGEYVTFYKDKALTLLETETEAALYTITGVGTETATAEQFDVIPASVPLLVKNNSNATKTILLIPTENAPLSFNYYGGFVGTLEATTIAASDASTNNYAFNGKQFVWVKNDLAVGANKAWLAIPVSTSNARTITLVFDETTKIANTNITNITNGNWYDLNGRKLDKMPTKKGIYILNGKKVVVK